MLHPGCPGTAERLPINPGSQKLKPPKSALAVVDAAVMTPSAKVPAKAFLRRDLLLAELFMCAPSRQDDSLGRSGELDDTSSRLLWPRKRTG